MWGVQTDESLLVFLFLEIWVVMSKAIGKIIYYAKLF